MTTIPAHQHREIAESFGVDADRYDRARPPYPSALIDRIVAGSPGTDVLDVGTGTGIVARQFQAAGCTVLGVEPDARMAEFARRGGLEVEVATFEAWDPAGRSFDAVVAGTVWHWVDPVAGVAKAAQVLRPGGMLAVFGHAFQVPAEVSDAMAAVVRRVMPDLPFTVAETGNVLDGYQRMYATFADRIREAGLFAEPQQWRFDFTRTYTRDEWLDQMPTQGGLTRLAPDKLAEVLDAVGTAIDAMGGSFTLPYATVAAAATLTPAGPRQ
jgi:SAM-dependent methyltransferase